MARILRILAIAVGLAIAVVAGLLGAFVVAGILLLVAVFALFGKAKFNVTVNRGARAGAERPPQPSPHAGGDVIDIEAKKVEPPPRQLT